MNVWICIFLFVCVGKQSVGAASLVAIPFFSTSQTLDSKLLSFNFCIDCFLNRSKYTSPFDILKKQNLKSITLAAAKAKKGHGLQKVNLYRIYMIKKWICKYMFKFPYFYVDGIRLEDKNLMMSHNKNV